jgi:hypothetical protein
MAVVLPALEANALFPTAVEFSPSAALTGPTATDPWPIALADVPTATAVSPLACAPTPHSRLASPGPVLQSAVPSAWAAPGAKMASAVAMASGDAAINFLRLIMLISPVNRPHETTRKSMGFALGFISAVLIGPPTRAMRGRLSFGLTD